LKKESCLLQKDVFLQQAAQNTNDRLLL